MPAPATAPIDSFCGHRSDFGRTPRLTIFGLTADQRLVKFNECRPGRLKEIGPVSGLEDDDEALVGIDFRVQDGELYGLGDGGGIYTIDTDTAEAFKVTELTVDLEGDSSAWTSTRRPTLYGSSAIRAKIFVIRLPARSVQDPDRRAAELHAGHQRPRRHRRRLHEQ